MAQVIDYDEHWTRSLETYTNHPTSRHRRRFVRRALARSGIHPDAFVFDYGCGTGILLGEIRRRWRLADSQLGGCDVSEEAISQIRQNFRSPFFFHGAYPQLERPIDVAVTTEVIEHTDQFEKILTWIRDHLRDHGTLVVTTPGGTMDPPDVYYGHIQHFRLEELASLIEDLGFSLEIARYWGFPFFTLQKWVTKQNFEKIKRDYMGGELNFKKRVIFSLAYRLYFLHDLIPMGPQIFIMARKVKK